MTKSEDRANRKITKAFIDSNPTCLALTPYEKMDDDTGSWKYQAGKPRKEQTVRLVDPYSPAPPQRTIDGLERQVVVEMLTESDATVELHDRYSLDGIEYEVTSRWNNDWGAQRFWVVRRG